MSLYWIPKVPWKWISLSKIHCVVSSRIWLQSWRHSLPARSTRLLTVLSWCSCPMVFEKAFVGRGTLRKSQTYYLSTLSFKFWTLGTVQVWRTNPRWSLSRPAVVVSADVWLNTRCTSIDFIIHIHPVFFLLGVWVCSLISENTYCHQTKL